MRLPLKRSIATSNACNNRGQDRTWTFRAAGAGFKTGDARALAEERIMKQITNDTSLPDTISAGQ
jgi:hypothetical protein